MGRDFSVVILLTFPQLTVFASICKGVSLPLTRIRELVIQRGLKTKGGTP